MRLADGTLKYVVLLLTERDLNYDGHQAVVRNEALSMSCFKGTRKDIELADTVVFTDNKGVSQSIKYRKDLSNEQPHYVGRPESFSLLNVDSVRVLEQLAYESRP